MHWNFLNFNEFLSRDDGSGIIRFFEKQRTLLFDAFAHGLLRKNLIDTLGLATTKSILTRFGYAQGWRLAEMLERDPLDSIQRHFTGPYMHSLYGHLTPVSHEKSDGTDGEPLIRTVWKDSYEAEQHRLHYGVTDECVCWTLTGFASGFVSKWRGRNVFFIETHCQGKGDSLCQVEARYQEDWDGRFADQLKYYDLESSDAIFSLLTQRVKDVEEQLKEKEQRLDMLDYQNSCFGSYSKSPTMLAVLEMAERVAKGDSSVVISGETGAGKERMARFIHERSPRAKMPFLAINCGAITESLLEGELFGFVKGAFSGATKDRAGFFEAADGGTLFLDEIGEISPGMQVKILRVLQEKEICRVGETCARPVDFRIVAATNKKLAEEVQAGTFRQDLFYRLQVIELKIPPLRERREDILPLARRFLDRTTQQCGRGQMSFTPEAADCLVHYDWPGNVRELQNTIEYAVAMCLEDKIDFVDFPEDLRRRDSVSIDSRRIVPLDELEKNSILAALKITAGNKTQAAKELNISLATLYRKLELYSAQS